VYLAPLRAPFRAKAPSTQRTQRRREERRLRRGQINSAIASPHPATASAAAEVRQRLPRVRCRARDTPSRVRSEAPSGRFSPLRGLSVSPTTSVRKRRPNKGEPASGHIAFDVVIAASCRTPRPAPPRPIEAAVVQVATRAWMEWSSSATGAQAVKMLPVAGGLAW